MNTFKILSFFHVWLCYVFAAAHGLPLVAESGGYSLVVMRRLLLLQNTDSRHTSFSGCDITGLSGSLEHVEYPKTRD